MDGIHFGASLRPHGADAGEPFGNGDGLASLGELASYIESFKDPYLYQYSQHVQAYPSNSDYAMFMRLQAPEE